MPTNLWILAEERPKSESLRMILQKVAIDYKFPAFVDTIRILPILQNGKFTFTYEVAGFRCNSIGKVFVKTVSGTSSFVDYLLFLQDAEPTAADQPLYAIEETKTDDQESRNTGVYQRAAKFVFAHFYYPDAKKIMLYNLRVEQKPKPTQTYIFGTRLLLTLGVEILGKNLDANIFSAFKSIEELIAFKSKMRPAPKGNTPISVVKSKSSIKISGRLYKNGSLSHDPNIGALSLMGAALRKLGWQGAIKVFAHGLEQRHITKNNKFIQIANQMRLSLEGLRLPKSTLATDYWHYEIESEKLGTIFIHLVVENFTHGYSIFENHAGCEKGYFLTKEGQPIPLAKYRDRAKYKSGDKSQITNIPDLILIDFGRSEIINVEGKRYPFRQQGIAKLATFEFIETNYIRKHYPEFKIVRTIVLYGSKEREVIEIEVGFLLNENGELILGVKAPELFKEGIKNLLDFWNGEA